MPLINNSAVAIIQQEYIKLPFYQNIWFWIFCLAIVSTIVWAVWYFIDRYFRNRIVCHVMRPNHTMQSKGFNRHKVSDNFLMTHQKIIDGKLVDFKFPYNIVPSAVKHSIFGDHLYYKYLNPRPLDVDFSDDSDKMSPIERDFKAILESGLIDVIYRNSGFEKFVRGMFIVILVLIILAIIGIIVSFFVPHNAILHGDNATIETIKYAVNQAIMRK